MKILRYLFCLILIFFIQSSLSLASLELQEDQKILLQAHTQLFHHYLGEIKKDLEKQHNTNPTLFICYAPINEIEDSPQLNTLAYDLICSGIKNDNLYYKLRPGGVTFYQHAERIFNVDKVIVIGSSKLKEDYEKQQGGRGHATQVIENLLTRISKKGTKGIIPLWFEGQFEDNFPLTFDSLAKQYLGKDYFLSFFDLLMNLQDLNPYNNSIQTHKTNFDRQKATIPQDRLARYGDKLLLYQQEQAKKDRQEIEQALFSSIKTGEDVKDQNQQRTIKLFRSWQSITNDPSFIPLNNLPDRPEEFIESKPHEQSRSYLDLLWQELCKESSATISALGKSSIAGMGGLGKTTLALKYAYEALDHKAYHLIYWLHSETEDTLIEGYKRLLQALNITFKEEDKKETIIALIKQYLPAKGKSLLIYDNVSEPKSLLNTTPQTRVDILITSRCNQGWGKSVINLEVFHPQEAVDYLLRTISLEVSNESQHQARILAQELGYLPLALSHAAGYLKYIGGENVSSDDIKGYIDDFRKSKNFSQDVFSSLPEISHEHLIARTWDLSGNKIYPFAKQLMTYFAYLEPDMIDSQIFRSQTKSDKEFKEALSQLRAFSLIKQNERYFAIHRLVQFVIRQEHEKTHLEELPNIFSSMLSCFDITRQSMMKMLYQNLDFSILEEFYVRNSSLISNLKTFYTHIQSLPQHMKCLKLNFVAQVLQTLLRDAQNSLRKEIYPKLRQSEFRQSKKTLENITIDEIMEKKIILSSEISKELVEVLPDILSLKLSKKNIKYVAESTAEVSHESRSNFINSIQNFLINKSHFIDKPNKIIGILRTNVNSSRCYKFINSIQPMLIPLKNEHNLDDIIKALSKIEESQLDKFVGIIQPLISRKNGKIIEAFCNINIFQLPEFIQIIKPLLILKIDGWHQADIINTLSNIDFLQLRNFVGIIQPFLSSEMDTGEELAALVEFLCKCKMDISEFRDFVEIIQHLFTPEIDEHGRARIIRSLSQVRSKERHEFVREIQPLLTAQMDGNIRAETIDILNIVRPTQRHNFVKSVVPLLISIVDEYEQVQIMRVFLKMDPSQYQEFLEEVEILIPHDREEPNKYKLERANVIRILSDMALAKRGEFVNNVKQLLTPHMKIPERSAFIQVFLKMDPSQYQEFVEQVQSVLPPNTYVYGYLHVIKTLAKVEITQRQELADLVKKLLKSNMTQEYEAKRVIEAIINVDTAQRGEFVSILQPLSQSLEKGAWIQIIENLASVNCEKRIEVCKNFVFFWKVLQQNENTQFIQDILLKNLIGELLEKKGLIGIIKICLQIESSDVSGEKFYSDKK